MVAVEKDTNLILTPVVVAKYLGPLKANAIAARIKALLPDIASSIMSEGVNASNQATLMFWDAIVDNTTVTAQDVAVLKGLGKEYEVVTIPRRFDRRFDPERWPHVAADGSQGGPQDKSISGFPNDITRIDFDTAWVAAGRLN
jgi:hypothetical protein